MLETIKSAILKSSQLVPFEQFFNLHIMSVQDENIMTEIKYNISRNNATVLDIERLAQDQHERLVDLN